MENQQSSSSLKTIIAIYNEVKKERNDYLVLYDYTDEPTINNDFFKELMRKISLQEDVFMKDHKKEITKWNKEQKNGLPPVLARLPPRG